MDVQKYIASGILEDYVLDLLSEEERQQVEQYAESYPQIRQELSAIEDDLTQYAQAQAIPLSLALKDKILNHIDQLDEDPTNKTTDEPPPKKPVKRPTNTAWIWLLLFFLALLVATIFFVKNSALQTDLQEAQNKLVICQDEKEELQGQIDDLLQILNNTVIPLKSTDDNQETPIAQVNHRPEEGTTSLQILNLPLPPIGKQYQVWALTEAGAVSIGLIDPTVTSNATQALYFIPAATGFAISEEDIGGKAQPTKVVAAPG